MSLPVRPRRLAGFAILLVTVGVLAAGCVKFNGDPTLVQTGDAGGTRLTVSMCADQTNCSASPGGPGAGSNPLRPVVAVQLPTSVVPPARVTATVTEAGTSELEGARRIGDEAAFNAANVPDAGNRWVLYLFESIFVGSGDSVTGTTTIDLPATFAADGSGPSAIAWRVGIAETDAGTDPSEDPATSDATIPTTMEKTTATAELALRTLVVSAPAAPAAVRAGSSAALDFGLRLDGGALPGSGVVSVAATSTISGATVTLGANSVTPTSGTRVAIPAQLVVPATTPVGTKGVVELVATTTSGETRRTSVPVTIAAASVVPVSTPPAPLVAAAAPVSRCLGTEKRGGTAGIAVVYTATKAARVQAFLQRRTNAPFKALKACPKSLRLGEGTAAKPAFSTTNRKAFAVEAGERRVTLAQLLAPKKVSSIKPGVYRVVIQATAADGSVATTTQSIFILG